MATVRVNKESNFTVLDNHILRNKEASLKAKGLLAWMLSLPDDWNYSIEGMTKCLKEQETSITSTLNELKELGYIKVTKLMPESYTNDLGEKVVIRSRVDYVYDVFERPNIDIQEQEILPLENLALEFQELENSRQINTNIQNTKEEKLGTYVPNPGQSLVSKKHSRNFRNETETLSDELNSLGEIEEKEEKRKEKKKSKTLWEKCIDEINKPGYMFSEEVKQSLKDFLGFALQPTSDGKHIKGINQLPHKLRALTGLSKDSDTQLKIIQQTMNYGSYGFFELGHFDRHNKSQASYHEPLADKVVMTDIEEAQRMYDEKIARGAKVY